MSRRPHDPRQNAPDDDVPLRGFWHQLGIDVGVTLAVWLAIVATVWFEVGKESSL